MTLLRAVLQRLGNPAQRELPYCRRKLCPQISRIASLNSSCLRLTHSAASTSSSS